MTKVSCCAGVCALFACASLSAATFIVSTGDSFDLDVSEAASINVTGNVIELGEGATLRLVMSSDGGVVRPNVRLRGAATVDAAALTSDSVRWTGALRSDGHKLTVLGTREIVIGANDQTQTVHYPAYDLPDVCFGTSGATGLVFTNQATIVALPPAGACEVTLARGLEVALRGVDTLARFYNEDGVLELTDWDVMLLEPLAALGTAIRVHGGRKLDYKPCAWDGDWNWAGVSGAFTNDVVLASDENGVASLRSLSQASLSLYGSVSGTGRVEQAMTSLWSEERFDVYARCTQTGEVRIVDGKGQLIFHQASPGDSANPVDVCKGGLFACHGSVDGSGESRSAVGDFYGRMGVLLDNESMARFSVSDREVVTIGTLRGNEMFVGDGNLRGRVIIENNLSTGFWIRGGERVTVVRNAIGEPAVRVLQGGSDSVSVLVCEDGEHPWKTFNVDVGATLLFAGTGCVSRVTGGGTLRLAPGARLTVDCADAMAKIVADDGELVLSAASAGWKDKVLLWLDASEASSMNVLVDAAGVEQTWTNGYRLVDAWYDRRPGKRDVYALNNRLWSEGGYDLQPQVYPYLVPAGGPNGLPYLHFGSYQQLVAKCGPGGSDATEARRLQFCSGKTATPSYMNIDVAWAVMVCGSAQGGGAALLGTRSGFYTRAGQTLAEAVAKNDFAFRLDGEDRRPGESKFNGSWQICSFAVGRSDVNAIGWNTSNENAGGLSFAEVILFAAQPSDLERIACERYVSEKWGVAVSAYSQAGCIGFGGNGKVVVAEGAEVPVNGSFSGEVVLQDGTLEIVGRSVIGAADVPSAGRVGWYDPELEGAVGMSTMESRPFCVRCVKGRDGNGVIAGTGASYMLGTYDGSVDRRPRLNAGSRGGWAVNWIDFGNLYDKWGNTLRHFTGTAPAGESMDTDATPVNVRTAFVSLDSVHGGGTPLIDTVAANDLIKARKPVTSISTPIWHAGTTSKVTDGVTRLDGEVVDGAATGYTGRPEVLSVETADTVPLTYFGWYGEDDAVNTPNVEVLGEVLLYDRLLSQSDRENVEAYLMGKWTGRLPKGFSDFSRATVSGLGVVKVPTLKALPSLAEDFAGTIRLTQTEYACRLDGDRVQDAMVVPYALGLPATCRMTVTFDSRPVAGTYALVSAAGGFANRSTWVLETRGTGSESARCRLRVQDGQVLLVVNCGLAIFIR